ncbi:MAG: hypothetical protein HXY18_13895 [Bryobacteraceae bacterium]|nr:hypothetical protein [Bryobacteraceae bacterium]
MEGTISDALEKVREALEGSGGLAESLEALRASYPIPLTDWQETRVEIARAPAEMEEKSRTLKYPRYSIAVEKIQNGRDERFRRFSGTLKVAVEIRVSQDRLDGITESLYWHVDAVRDVIERKAGCLSEGLVLTGEYEVQVEGVKKGGLNFLQSAKVVCPVLMSRR